jgi:hypothetical protein
VARAAHSLAPSARECRSLHPGRPGQRRCARHAGRSGRAWHPHVVTPLVRSPVATTCPWSRPAELTIGCGGRAVPDRSRPALPPPPGLAGARPGSPVRGGLGGWLGWVHYRPPGLRGRPSPTGGHARPRRARHCRVPARLSGGPDPPPRWPSLIVGAFREPGDGVHGREIDLTPLRRCVPGPRCAPRPRSNTHEVDADPGDTSPTRETPRRSGSRRSGLRLRVGPGEGGVRGRQQLATGRAGDAIGTTG